MALIGITGSIGMGKTTVAKMFAARGCSLWNADDAVHALYAKGGAAVEPIRALCPDAIKDHTVSRLRLKEAIAKDASLLARIEAVVHPLLKEHREAFIVKHQSQNQEQMMLFDIPLLYETGAETWLDCVIVVTAPADIQRARVFARDCTQGGGQMSEAHFEMILAKQMPDAEKCKRADYIIENIGLAQTEQQVEHIMADLKVRYGNS